MGRDDSALLSEDWHPDNQSTGSRRRHVPPLYVLHSGLVDADTGFIPAGGTGSQGSDGRRPRRQPGRSQQHSDSGQGTSSGQRDSRKRPADGREGGASGDEGVSRLGLTQAGVAVGRLEAALGLGTRSEGLWGWHCPGCDVLHITAACWGPGEHHAYCVLE